MKRNAEQKKKEREFNSVVDGWQMKSFTKEEHFVYNKLSFMGFRKKSVDQSRASQLEVTLNNTFPLA